MLNMVTSGVVMSLEAENRVGRYLTLCTSVLLVIFTVVKYSSAINKSIMNNP